MLIPSSCNVTIQNNLTISICGGYALIEYYISIKQADTGTLATGKSLYE
jgi:hypothetical protein